MHPHPHERGELTQAARGVRAWVILRHRWFRRLSRWQRWAVRIGVVLPLFLLTMLLVLARSPITRSLVIPRLESALNLDIEADRVFVAWNGRLVLDGLRCRIPGMDGPAGLILKAERVRADVGWIDSIAGVPTVREVEFIQPVVRMSQSIIDRRLNVEAFKLPSTARGGGPLVLPRVVARDASIELGEHAPGRYDTLKRLPVEGILTPADDGTAAYVVGLTELRRDRGGGPLHPGFVISGRFTDDAMSLVMENFNLADWPAQSIPTPTRNLFENLAAEGKVTRMTFEYDHQAGPRATLELAGGEINLPIPPEDPDAAHSKFMRMRAVTGRVEFRYDELLVNARGMLEDLPYTVTLLYQGRTADAPFTCDFASEGFLVEKFPRLLPYAPAVVRERLASFSGPTATVTTRLKVWRGPPTPAGPAEIEFKGWMDVANGRAAFHLFPYEFHDLQGRVYFDSHRVEISDVRGVSDSGAVVTARGVIAPPTDAARLDIYVDITGAPIDDRMRAAFGPKRERLLTALCSPARYLRLLETGLVITPARAAELRARAAELRAAPGGPGPELAVVEAQLERPVFDFGGNADVAVHVHRPFGLEVEWVTDVEVRLPRVGLLPDAFPVPVHARDVVCRIRNEDAVLVGGSYAGLAGGTGTVAATFRVPRSGDPAADPRPDITIDLQGVPFDELVIRALPGPEDGPTALKRVLRDLRITGVGEGRVHVAPMDVLGRADGGGDAGRTGFDADLRIVRADAAPGEPGTPLIVGVTGTLGVTERSLKLAASGRTAGEVGADAPVAIETTAAFAFRADGDEPGRDRAPPDIETQVRVAGADLRLAVERVVGVFSPKAADEVKKLRAKHQPSGLADVDARVSISKGATRSVLVGLEGARAVEFDWLGGRVGVPESSGRVEVQCIGGVLARFDGLGTAMAFDARPVGNVRLDGWYRFAAPPAGAAVAIASGPADPLLRVHAEGGRFESPFVTAVLAAPLGRERLATYEGLRPAGEFAAEVEVRGGGGAPLNISGLVEPRTFAFELDGVPVSFRSLTGSVEFGGGQGAFHRLSGRADEWSFTVEGSWRAQDGGVLLDLAIASQGSALTPDARVVLPRGLRDALDGIKLEVRGPFAVTDARLSLLTGVPPERAWSRFQGTVGFEGIALEAGVAVTECNGRFNARFERPTGTEPGKPGDPAYRVGVLADSMRVAGVHAGDARIVVQSGQTPGEVLVPLLTGVSHGGRFSGNVRLAPPHGAEREYTAAFQVAGVDFGQVLNDRSEKPDAAPPAPGVRGLLDAELTLAGFVKAPEARRGRGSLRVSGDNVRILDLPGILPLIEVSNLQPPANDSLDFAEAGFFIDGGLISFEHLAVLSRAIEIAGFGTMTWPQTELDLRLNSRSARPIPVVSWVFQGIRNQLVGTQVRGTLREPKVRLVTMPNTRRMLGPVVGAGETERSRRLLELERRSGPSRHGIRPVSPGVRGASGVEGP